MSEKIIRLPIEDIRIEDIKIDASMDPRFGEERSQSVVEGYMEALDRLPPIVIDQDNHIIDGVHRYQAHLLAGKDTIQVYRQEMQDEGAAFIASVEANTSFGQPLKAHQRRDAARRLYRQYGFPNSEIETAVNRGPSTVTKWLSDLKDEWKAHIREAAYSLYEGTDAYVDKAASKAMRKRGISQREIAERLSGPREKALTTRTLRNYIEERREELKAAKDVLEKAEQPDEADAASDVAAPTPETADTTAAATDTYAEPAPTASESRAESHDSESESIDEPADREEDDGQADDQAALAEEPAPEPDIPAQPTADEAEGDGQKEAKVADTSKITHPDIQNMLLWLGKEMGLDLWVAKDDQEKEYGDSTLSLLHGTLSSLPEQDYKGARKTIRNIDVIWIEAGSIVAAFEVEHTTRISTGLLRLSDLKLVNELNCQPHPYLCVVADRQDDDRVRKEINRLVFRKIGLPEHCRYISYGQLVNKYNEVKQSSSPPDDWRQFLDDIADENL